MILDYDGLQFKMFEMPNGHRENVYSTDGVDLLYTKHIYQFLLLAAPGGDPAGVQVATTQTGLLSPAREAKATVRRMAGGTTDGTGINPDFSGRMAFPQTDAALRFRMMMPRKKLVIKVKDYATGEYINWIQAPLLGGPSDAANGPTPLAFDIVKPQGEGVSAILAWTVEFNLCPQHPNDHQLILSHRWQTSHTSDEDYYLTRVITGEVVCNGELLRAAGHELDWYRNQFFHPIPEGMVRSVPEVTQSSDGLTVRYVIRDRDPEIMFDAADSGATQIAIHESVNRQSPDYMGVMEDSLFRRTGA